MPPKAKKTVFLMITNVGSTSLEQYSLDDEPFIDKAKYTMRLLVEKKIFMQPKDEFGIVTMGDETDNPDNIDNVKIYHQNLLIPNWEMVKYINNLEFTNKPSNWIEALYVGLNFLKKEVSAHLDCNVIILIFNNYKESSEDINAYDSDVISAAFKKYDYHLLFVGEKELEEMQSNPTISEEFVLAVIDKTEAEYQSLAQITETLRFYTPTKTNSRPWKFNLEIANLRIPCAEYIKTTTIVKKCKWKMFKNKSQSSFSSSSSFQGPSVGSRGKVVRESIRLDHHRNKIGESNIIKGYKFGRTYIPYSAEDKSAFYMLFDKVEKSVKVHSFVKQHQVKLEYWGGKGSRIIVPQSKDHLNAFYFLVKAMVSLKLAAIIRKVYSKNTHPKMGVLFPRMVDDDVLCLVHLEIPFAGDTRRFIKKPIKTIDMVSKEKQDALDDYIDAMTIADDDDELDYFSMGMLPNIKSQYQWNVIAHRAVNPNDPLPPPNEYIKKYLEPPENLKSKAAPFIKKLDELFENCNSIKKKSIKNVAHLTSVSKKEEDVEKTLVQDVPKDEDDTNSPKQQKPSIYDEIDLKMEEVFDDL